MFLEILCVLFLPVVGAAGYFGYKAYKIKNQNVLGTKMSKPELFAPEKLPDRIDDIIIGGGVSGLVCAASLAEIGHHVCILEKAKSAGGALHGYSCKGYEFDSGIHFIGDQIPGWMDYEAIREFCEEPVDMVELRGGETGNAYDVIQIGDKVFEVPAGVDNYKRALYSYFPDEHQAINDFFVCIEEAKNTFQTTFPLKIVPSFLVPVMKKNINKGIKYVSQTIDEVVDSLTDNKVLKQLLTHYFTICGGSTSEVSFAVFAEIFDHYQRGAFYPAKGGIEIAKQLISYILHRNGVIFTKADVDEIMINGDNVVEGVKVKYLNESVDIKCNSVISSVGMIHTYDCIKSVEDIRSTSEYQFINHLQPSDSSVIVELVLDGKPEDYGITASNYWFFPEGSHSENIEKYYREKNHPIPAVYFTCISAKSPYFHDLHPDKCVIQALTICGQYEWFDKWRSERPKNRSEGYEEVKDQIANQLLEYIFNRFPGTRDKEILHRSSSPLTNEYYMNSPKGSCYGLKPTPEVLMNGDYFPIVSKYKGLCLTGQDIFCHGIVGAWLGGFLTSLMVDKYVGITFVELMKRVNKY